MLGKRVLISISFTLLFVFIPRLGTAAEVILKGGQTVSGEIVEENTGSIQMELPDGEKMEIERSEIASIDYADEKTFKREYPVLGSTFGLPGVFNAVGGYYFKDFGFVFSGGVGGVQLDLAGKIVESKDFLLGLSLAAGHFWESTNITLNGVRFWNYVGAGISVNWRGITLQINPVSNPDFTGGIWPFFQIGFVNRFN